MCALSFVRYVMKLFNSQFNFFATRKCFRNLYAHGRLVKYVQSSSIHNMICKYSALYGTRQEIVIVIVIGYYCKFFLLQYEKLELWAHHIILCHMRTHGQKPFNAITFKFQKQLLSIFPITLQLEFPPGPISLLIICPI